MRLASILALGALWGPAASATTISPPPSPSAPCDGDRRVVQDATDVRLDTNLVYSVAGHRLLELDLARPRDVDRRPLVLLLHAAFPDSDPSKRPLEPLVALARRGYVAAVADYRVEDTADSVRVPAGVRDAHLALEWLRSHAGDLGIDINRVAVMSQSAGGEMVTLLGRTQRFVDIDYFPAVVPASTRSR